MRAQLRRIATTYAVAGLVALSFLAVTVVGALAVHQGDEARRTASRSSC